jgi:hypothetical protein
MYRYKTKFRLLVSLAVLAWLAVPSQCQPPNAIALTVNLRSYGWEPPDRREITRPSIAVDHLGRVLVGFTVRERNGLVTGNRPSLSLHIVRLSPDGKTDLSLSLPTNEGGRSGMYLSDSDQIIARANGSVQLLQEDDGARQKAVWKILAPCATRCTIEQSLTRHTLLLHAEDADPPLMLIHLSPQPELRRCGMAHRLTKSPEDEIQNIPQITDEFGYHREAESGKGSIAYRWPLCDYEHRIEMPMRIRGHWIVLNDNVFVDINSSRTGYEELEVTSSDGQVEFQPTMLKHEFPGSFWTPVRGSERGNEIAVDMLTVQGRNRTLDISGHVTARRIAVFDIEAKKEVASIPVNSKHRFRFEFDLSPDGRRLAILEDDTVKVVDLEEAAKTAE